MGEGGVDDNSDLGIALLSASLRYHFLELGKARCRSALGRQVRAVDDNVSRRSHEPQSTMLDVLRIKPSAQLQGRLAPGQADTAGSPSDPSASAIKSASSSSWIVCDPVAGLPDGARLT